MKTPFEYRIWLWLPVLMFILIWIFTPTVFWPMISELYGLGRGRIVESDAQVLRLVRRWIIFDWLRGWWPSRWRFCRRFGRSAFLFLVRRGGRSSLE